jgi:hypothetical protein
MRRPGPVDLIDGECPNCGGGTLVLAKTCSKCGAPLKLRMAGILVAGALVLLMAAIVLAVAVVLRGDRLAAATETGAPADQLIAAEATADFSWLASAMAGCETEAKTNAGALHFLVTPLVSVAEDIEPWRTKSINDAGSGILLRSDDALEGLKSGTLRVYPADYQFSISDQADDTVYKWRPSVGVAKLSTADAAAFASFRVRFRTVHNRAGGEWGGTFTRQEGSCYWVNPIIGD